MKNKFIAIEGLDGAGKSTQINLLIEYFEQQQIQTKFVHFPRSHEGVFGDLIAKFLRGEFGDVKNVHPQLVALLFAEDRREFSSTIRHWLNDGYMVLVDRYVLSNIAFQCAKTEGEQAKAELRAWIYSFEYAYNQIPQPDFSIFLDVPFAFTQHALNEKRGGDERSYLLGKDDIHEKDMNLQMKVKQEYEAIVQMEKNIRRIRCFNEALQMRSISDIHEEILGILHDQNKA